MKRILLGIAVGSVVLPGLAFVHPFGNPRVEPQKGLNTLLSNYAVAPEARKVLINKCADCHSNETRWPAYARIAPGSWLIERDIVEARKKLNLSLWNDLSPDAQDIMIGKIMHEARSGEMPPLQYRLLHGYAGITPQEIAELAKIPTRNDAESTGSSAGNVERGKAVFEKRCTGCHALTEGREGPPLANVFGRKAGAVSRFEYSNDLKNSGIIWDDANLEKWLTDPDAMVPNNKMDFHLPKAQERSDVISYFRSISK